MNKRESMKLVDSVFYHAAFDGPQDGFSTVRDILYNLELDAEKRHRKGRGVTASLSVKEAARLWTVYHVAQALDKPNRWTADDVIVIRLECMKAQAYANRHRVEFTEAMQGRIADVLAADYPGLMG